MEWILDYAIRMAISCVVFCLADITKQATGGTPENTTLVMTDVILTPFHPMPAALYVQSSTKLIPTGPNWESVPGLQSYTIEGRSLEYQWKFNCTGCDNIGVRINHAPSDSYNEHPVVSVGINVTDPQQQLVLPLRPRFQNRYKVTFQSNTITLTINGCVISDTGIITLQLNFPDDTLRKSTMLEVYKVPKWEAPHGISTGTLGSNLSFVLHLEKNESIPSIDRVDVRFFALNSHTSEYDNATMIIRGRGLERKWQPSNFEKILDYVGDARLEDLKFVIPNLDEDSLGFYQISIMCSEVGYVFNHIQGVISSDTTALYHSSESNSQTTHMKGCYVGLSLAGSILLAVFIVLVVLLKRTCEGKGRTNKRQQNQDQEEEEKKKETTPLSFASDS